MMLTDILVTFTLTTVLALLLRTHALLGGWPDSRKALPTATPCERTRAIDKAWGFSRPPALTLCERRALELPRIDCDLHPVAVNTFGGRWCENCGHDHSASVRPRGPMRRSLGRSAAEAHDEAVPYPRGVE